MMPTTSTEAKSYSPLEAALTKLINDERAEAGLKPVHVDVELLNAAGRHTDWMLAQDKFSHTGAGGSTPGARATEAGFGWTSVAENIAMLRGSAANSLDMADITALHDMLTDSAGHRANILNPNITDI